MKVNERTIFVSIVSYSDPLCNATLKSLFEKAKNPERIFVGLVEQELPGSAFKIYKHPRVRILKRREARGPAWARFLASTLWEQQDYFMQIDSHTSFIRDWDERIISMFDKLPRRSVITCYPPGENYTDDMCMKTTADAKDNARLFKGHFIAPWVYRPKRTICTPGVFVGANFIFTDARSFLEEIPFDPNLEYLFQGEEILLSLRLFTRNWGIYHPEYFICTHVYGREDQPKVWDLKCYKENNSKSLRRYHRLIFQPDVNGTLWGSGSREKYDEWKKMVFPI